MKSAATISRRSLLGFAALALAACKKGSSASVPHRDPDATALADARASEEAILAMYDAQLAGATGDTADLLTARRAAHAEHLTALGGTPSSPPNIGTSTAQPFGQIGRVLQDSATSLRGAAVAAVDGAHAATLASIAASHQAMVHG
ncbi:MAG: hypothetical protein ACTHK4_05165 [Mycobacteriales bacterium]